MMHCDDDRNFQFAWEMFFILFEIKFFVKKNGIGFLLVFKMSLN